MKVTFAMFFDAGIAYVLSGVDWDDWNYQDGLKATFCQSIDLMVNTGGHPICLVVKIPGIGQPQKIFFGGRYFIQGE